MGYLKNKFGCLVMLSKHEKAINLEGAKPRDIAFECFGTLINHTERKAITTVGIAWGCFMIRSGAINISETLGFNGETLRSVSCKKHWY